MGLGHHGVRRSRDQQRVLKGGRSQSSDPKLGLCALAISHDELKPDSLRGTFVGEPSSVGENEKGVFQTP